jgi:hypothetical protein
VLPADDVALSILPAVTMAPGVSGAAPVTVYGTRPLQYGEIGGVVRDQEGQAIPGATITLTGASGTREKYADGNGAFVFSDLPRGQYEIRASLTGFQSTQYKVTFAGPPRPVALTLAVAGMMETIEVVGEAPTVDTASSAVGATFTSDTFGMSSPPARRKDEPEALPPSANVANLQKRVAGVLPVRLDVPRAGNSYRFFRPLVVDEETTIRFAYKRR